MFESVIGLETHIQLNTRSKIFCACKADSWGEPPNTNICPVCTGLPGVLPALNRAVVEKAVRLAAAVHVETWPGNPSSPARTTSIRTCRRAIRSASTTNRWPRAGTWTCRCPTAGTRRVTIWKLHLEEDAGKTVHRGGRRLIDFNRCGVPLVEMVTGPDLRSADEAAQYLIRLRQLLRWLDISEADMEKGQLRCDANVSIRPAGIDRPQHQDRDQERQLDRGSAPGHRDRNRPVRSASKNPAARIEAWTLEWDEDAGMLRKMRSKETEADYRYFREPDLLPILLDPRPSAAASWPTCRSFHWSAEQRFVQALWPSRLRRRDPDRGAEPVGLLRSDGAGAGGPAEDGVELDDERRAAPAAGTRARRPAHCA